MERLITGLHGIEEAIRSGKKSGVLYLSRKNSRINSMKSDAEKAGITVQNIPPAEMHRRFGDNRGVVLQLYISAGAEAGGRTGLGKVPGDGVSGGTQRTLDFEQAVEALGGDNLLVVILDGVTDPHNYGAVLRCADQFGAELVVSRSRRSASESDTVARTSAGAVSYVPTAVVKNLGRADDYLKKNNFWIYGADMNGTEIEKTDLCGRTAIVMGSEGGGLSRLIADKCDGIISIPSRGRIDSLNVSVAAGIIMYEVRRQQGSK